MIAALVLPFSRFIPAGAGNTGSRLRRSSRMSVYPRWRGEHKRPGARVWRLYGLSPLARGTRRPQLSTYTPWRFIPAGAGNTSRYSVPRLAGSVYPRWRGEHPCAFAAARMGSGLSPLARGTPRTPVLRSPRWRFIPAGAGNTGYEGCAASCEPVYPRWRGEHTPRGNNQE